jgi:two-component sensor histidine kinase
LDDDQEGSNKRLPQPEVDGAEMLLATPDLAGALESAQFRRFLDQVPIAIAVSKLSARECIVYVSPEFEKVSGHLADGILGMPWSALSGEDHGGNQGKKLGFMILDSTDFIGTFTIQRDDQNAVVDAYSNVIEDDDGTPCYRLVALVDVGAHHDDQREKLEQRIREKDVQLFEIQHRVKNNLQMITALMRIEARNAKGLMDTAPFDRLAGRVESMQLLYAFMSEHGKSDEIDLGAYLSEISASVLHSYAVEGIRLDLTVDVYPVSVNVAMPTGMVVNELLTNALKHAFVGREGGTITVNSFSGPHGCRITIADDGVGLPEGVVWPKRGKLSALIVQSLLENAKANLTVESAPGQGMRVIIEFSRAAAAPAHPV